MASTVEINMREGCNDYDLYISSELRRSLEVNSSNQNGDTKIRFSMMNMMYKSSPETYNNILNDTIKNFQSKKMLFLGVSNDSFVGIAAGQIILDTVNSYLRGYQQNAKIKRVVLTNEIGEKDPPKCYPIVFKEGQVPKYKHAPNLKPPGKEDLYWEPHLAVYLNDHPDLFHYPRDKIAGIVQTDIGGKEVKATFENKDQEVYIP